MKKHLTSRKPNTADICFILEGTYPFIAGGVSSWVHQMINAFPDFTFALACILPEPDKNWQPKYTVPENVIEQKVIFLQDQTLPTGHQGKPRQSSWEALAEIHGSKCPFHQPGPELQEVYSAFLDPDSRRYSPEDLLNSREAWEILTQLYEEHGAGESFMDYFWSTRFTHIPMIKVLSEALPPARLYHTVSTGYAGIWASLARIKYNKPLLITEHGIYTRERRIEISLAKWIYEKETKKSRAESSRSHFKELWNRLFSAFSKLAYACADQIITLYEGNQMHQLNDGADPDKLSIIPNGIEVDKFSILPRTPPEVPGTLRLGFMGRVVSIKDVKTFIRACKYVSDQIARIEVFLMGPTDEEPHYYQECVRLVEILGMQDLINFTGKVNVMEYYPKIDILVLTSISEAQPLVILEANSAGIPVVSTDVGACEELLFGRTDEDRALGKSGLLAGVTNARGIADAILNIWKTEGLYDNMAAAGRERVRRYYNKTMLESQYRAIYLKLLGRGQSSRSLHAEPMATG